MATRRMLVRGRVQQVGFRAFVLRRAGELGLTGHVRNTPDGSVEVVASGPDHDLDRLERHLGSGPPLAVVAGIEQSVLPDRDFCGFRVLA